MSTITPPAVLPAEDRALEERYLRLLNDCDNRAIRSKRWMLTSWNATLLLTWVPLLLAIAALAGWLPRGVLESYIMPAASSLVFFLTITQLRLVFRNSWLKHRAATERLRQNCMLFRTRLNKFCGDDAAQTFSAALEELKVEVSDRRPFRPWNHIPWSVLVGLKALPEKLRAPLEHSPDKELYPPCHKLEKLEDAEKIIIAERLHNQQRWHLLKARRYSRIYLALMGGILLLNLTSFVYGIYCFLAGSPRELALLAMLSMLTLFLYAYRDWLRYDQLCIRYTRIVETLEQIESDYLAQKKREEGASIAQRLDRLRRTAELIELSLSSEFQYWYLGRENFGGAKTC
jgi:hypothetical protein